MKPWLAGSLIAIVAVTTGAFFITDPPVYGLCVACHTRDLLTGSAPLLTGIGLLAGAFLAARLHGEVRPRRPARPARHFLLGLAAMVASLIAMGCTVRLLLRAAYGDTLAWWALGGTVAGVALGTWGLRLHARRGLP